jgi:CHAD domain-containing protein
MERVLEEIDKVGEGFAPDSVHDLRVALRRCRSMAGGLMAIDRDKTWKMMRKEGRGIFKPLGALRDTQVLSEWALHIGGTDDPATAAILAYLSRREPEIRKEASESIRDFDREKWHGWIGHLQARTRRLPPGGAVFQISALQAWNEAHELHRQAMRNRSILSYHRLRIGLKRFRYIVENFLADLNAKWGEDLKNLQDWLGELHDLSVLWETAARVRAFPDVDSRKRWRALIDREREKRIEQYRLKMMGENSLWDVWRAGLPAPNRLRALSLMRMETWASFHGISLSHARRVRRLALQLFNGLHSKQSQDRRELKTRRAILHAAAILHEAGRSKGKKVKKEAKDLLRQSSLPRGFTAESLQLAAMLISKQNAKSYRATDPEFSSLPEERRQMMLELAGILRLARVLARDRESPVQSLEVQRLPDSIIVFAEGYSEIGSLAEKVARARYTLEVACQMPVFIRGSLKSSAASV